MKKIIFGLASVSALFAVVLVFSPSSENTSNIRETEIVNTLQDAHGLAVDRKDSSKVYIATHTGLLAMINDKRLQRVSDAQDDYMGFSAHPTAANILYSSGHPSTGGNIGFQKSTDGGKTWQKVSDGINGPVDFHTMSVSHADPSIIYGVYRGQLQRSINEGKDWNLVPANIGGISALATSPTSKDTVYAGTTEGLVVSNDQGNSWSKPILTSLVTSVVVNPKNDNEIIAYSEDQGLVASKDGGSTWSKLTTYKDSAVMQLAYDVQNPSTLYIINQNLEIHKTDDAGNLWKKVR